MSLAQLHHTSSGPGLAAVSPGVPPGIRKAAEHLFGYVPPRGTPCLLLTSDAAHEASIRSRRCSRSPTQQWRPIRHA
ncbi:hypothetical protein, partial [Streptomyces albidoflavus]|uniref:hypothetical protein n=1 Tax=Streptomyces albidoflavus TaxID=1886 RepID=UPI00117DF1EF